MQWSIPDRNRAPDSMESCPMCRSGSPEGYKLSDYIRDDLFETDSAPGMPYEQAVHILKHRLVPAFVDRRGKRVSFEGLDEVTKSGMITGLTRPVPDIEAFVRTMPKGNWSDYKDSGEIQPSGGGMEVDSISESGQVRRVRREKTRYRSYDDDGRASAERLQRSQSEPINPQEAETRRKDSAQSIEEIKAKAQQRPHSNQPAASSFGCQLSSVQTPPKRRRPVPHEKITFVDEINSIVRRTMPIIEHSWHESKYRVSPSVAELLAEWGEDNVIAHPHRDCVVGSIRSTPAKSSPLRKQ